MMIRDGPLEKWWEGWDFPKFLEFFFLWTGGARIFFVVYQPISLCRKLEYFFPLIFACWNFFCFGPTPPITFLMVRPLYKTLYGRTFDLRVKSKYVGLNNRNKDHLPQLSLVYVCTKFGGTGGDLGKLWLSEFLPVRGRACAKTRNTETPKRNHRNETN